MAPFRKSGTRTFRSAFVVFLILVAVPSLAISSFGIMAIVDARDVVQARLKASYEEKLARVARDLAHELKETHVTSAGVPPGAAESMEDARAAYLARVHEVLPQLSSRYFPVESAVVEMVRDSGSDRREWTAERMRQGLDEWIKSRAEVGGLLHGDVASELRMPPPLSEYRLQVRLLGDELLHAQARTTAVLYAVLLMLFYAILFLGVVVVSVNMYREIQLNRLKTDFVSHVSHELRTPLTSIRMFLDTMRMGRTQTPQETQECLALCTQETERLSDMIERVLDWARVEAGRRVYHKVRCPAGSVADRALKAFRTQTLAAPYDLKVDLSARDVPIQVDPDAVADALLNLLNNAFKYTGAEKRIEVTLRTEGRWVCFDVLDNGIGVQPEEQHRIFERFYRAEHPATLSAHGSGLGLALAKRMVEANGGRVLLESEPGKGSVFTLRFPRARGMERADAAGTAQSRSAQGTP